MPERSGDAEEDAVSHLDEELLTRPEDALRAVIAELRRAVGLCVRSHGCATHLILERQPALIRRVMRNEEAMDELKAAIRDYLTRLTRRYLSRRQAILLQYLDRVAWNVERIHDHLTVIVDLSVRRYREPEACYQVDDLDRLMDLHDHVGEILERLQQSLDPDAIDYYEGGQRVLSAANAFMMRSAETQRVFTDRIGRHVYPSLSGLFYSEYVFTYDRIAIHARRIAETECESDFWIKQSKLGRVEPPVPPYTPPERVSVRAYLEARRNRRETPWTPTPTAGAGGRPMAGGRRHGFSGAAGEINGAEGDE